MLAPMGTLADRLPSAKAVAIVIGAVLAGWAFGYSVGIFAAASPGEQLNAAAAVAGGIIAAAGAAIGVYLTLAVQRDDDTQKVEAAIRMEAAEFGRLALGPLWFLCQNVLVEHTRIPVRDLPALLIHTGSCRL